MVLIELDAVNGHLYDSNDELFHVAFVMLF